MTEDARLPRRPNALPPGTVRARTFQSRENVWSMLESMSREQGVPIDELINEAMAAYARVRGYPLTAGPESPVRITVAADRRESVLEETLDAISPLDRAFPSRPRPRDPRKDDLAPAHGGFARSGPTTADYELADETRTSPRRSALPVPAALNRPVSGLASFPSASRPEPRPARAGGLPPPPPPPPPRAFTSTERLQEPPPARQSAARTKELVLTYQGRPYSVDKDRFLIGRSKTQSDLRLDDPNVSRQHAVIERVGAAWYVVDLGSTNGVHVGGERVGRRAISDGDVLVITTHEIRCALR